MPLKLFGKAQQAPSAQDSIRKLQETLELLEKREEYLQKKMDRELVTAKKNAVTNKRGELRTF
jgi:charged multivesicular body protein 4A/B